MALPTSTTTWTSGLAVGDADAYTKLLLHFNTADGSTVFKDSSASNHVLTAAGNVAIDTAQYKFGGSSCYFDGTGDYITIPHSADFAWGSGRFTIDFWARIDTLPLLADGCTFYIQYTDAENYISFGLTHDSDDPVTYTLNFLVRESNVLVVSVSKEWTPVVDTWYHIAVIRGWGDADNAYAITVDGEQVGTTVTDTTSHADIAGNVTIGRFSASSTLYMNGWLDEFRISKGIARWTEAFTPPTAEYSLWS